MDRWKAETGRVREKRRVEERRSEKRKSQKNEDPGARKGRKVAKNCVFPMICGSGGSKSRLAKPAGAEPSGQMRDEKLHAVVARSTFRSQNVQSTPASDNFLKLGCWKIARCCGAKHICKWKSWKHRTFGPVLEVEMSKKCTPLWREANFEVNMYKTQHSRTTFGSWDVEKVHALMARSTFRSQNVKTQYFRTTFGSWDVEKVHAVVARSTFRSQNVKTRHVRATFGRSDVVSRGRRKGLCTLSKVSKREGFVAFSTTTTTTPHYTPIDYTTTTTISSLQSTSVRYTTLHYTALRYTQLRSITVNYTTLHYTTFHYTTLHYTTLHSITLQLQRLTTTTIH